MFTRRIAALAAALLTAVTIAAASTGGTAAAFHARPLTVHATGSAHIFSVQPDRAFPPRASQPDMRGW